MTAIQSTKVGENTAKVCGEIANGTDTLKKAAGVTISVIEIATDIFGFFPVLEGISAGLGLLKTSLKDTKTIINATSILGRGFEWADDNMRASITKTWQKTANRVVLTVAQVFETVGFIDKLSVGFFSQPSLCIGGSMPIFDIVKNSLYAISSVFGLWQAVLELQEGSRGMHAAGAKKTKWERRSMELGELDKFKFQQVVEKYTKKLDAEKLKGDAKNLKKIEKYNAYLNLLHFNESPENYKERVKSYQNERLSRWKDKFNLVLKGIGTSPGIGTTPEISKKIDDLKEKIKELNIQLKTADKEEKKTIRKDLKAASKELVWNKTNLVKAEKLETYIKVIYDAEKDEVNLDGGRKLIDHKIEVQKVRIHNCKNLHTKSWISIAAEVGKIFMITVGMLLQGLSIFVPQLNHVAARLTMSSCGLVANSFGLAKNLYRDVFYKSNMQKLPVLNAAASAA